MATFGQDRGRVDPKHTQAFSHPLRLRIVELFAKDPDRSSAVGDLASDLGDDFAAFSVAQVNYHLRYLQRVGLVPESGRN
jgi:hypothetical protein